MAVAASAAQAARMLLTQPTGPAGTAAHKAAWMLGLLALVTWLLDAGSGGYMLTTWIRRGGLRRVRAAGDKLAPVLVFSHFGLASSGLLLWASFLITHIITLAWVAVSLLTLVIGLGISTVTLWTPFPARGTDDGAGHGAGDSRPVDGGRQGRPAQLTLTDHTLAQALTDKTLLDMLVDDVVSSVPAGPGQPPPRRRRQRDHIAALIPAGHGIAAMATVVLAVLAAVAAI